MRVVLLGALLLAILGATVGSWIGGRNPAPLPSNAEALVLAQEIIPGVTPDGETDRRDYEYGSRLGDESYGPGFVEVNYEPLREYAPEVIDCGPGRATRANAATHGWQHFRGLPGYPCASWSAERGNLVAEYTHDAGGPVVTFYRATPAGVAAGTLIGALLGALAGAFAFHVLRSRHRPMLLRVAVPAAVVLLPGAAIILSVLVLGGYEGPTPVFWTVWPTLARLFFS
ncbi:hypothetical protein ACNAW0_20580 [Micromonospora sp. SL1-18]|uniref:hypothetical protein n=1 Tax=Micromonospora sp. SL1-18 TaxID=3399128 RepID=UPI003A4D8127